MGGAHEDHVLMPVTKRLGAANGYLLEDAAALCRIIVDKTNNGTRRKGSQTVLTCGARTEDNNTSSGKLFREICERESAGKRLGTTSFRAPARPARPAQFDPRGKPLLQDLRRKILFDRLAGRLPKFAA